MFQYKGCGLDNVYLANGYERRKTSGRTEVLHIEDLEGLHKTIALTLAVNPLEIGAAEFRFLRKELDMSQRVIAEVLGVQEQTVSLWERGEQSVPQYAKVLIATMTREYFSGHAAMKSVIDRVCAVDRAIERANLLVERTDQGAWIQKAA
jgi:DNA-binding transcriptional regulator YiaG